MDDEGHITLRIVEKGTTRTYEFDSREDFQKSEPELYKRFGGALEDPQASEPRSSLSLVLA